MDMMSLLSVVLLFGLIFLTAFLQLSAILWTIILAVALLIVSIGGFLCAWFLVPVWLIFLAAAAFANLTTLRQRYIVTTALHKLQKQLPTISPTEQEAIDAGNTWWEKELFCGRPKWSTLFSYPKPTLSNDEQAFLDNQVMQLCSMFSDWQVVYEQQDLPQPVWDYLRREKFFGMIIPKEYGGLGFSAIAHSTVIVKIATHCTSAAVNTMVPNSLGPAELLLHYGTDEQKNYYLPRLASGNDIPCFALTAPEAGSDAGAIADMGVVCYGEYEGKQTLGMRVSWDKRYITLAPVATVLGLAIKLYDPDHLLGDEVEIGITLCLVPTNHPGVEIGHRHYPMYLAFMNGPTRGKDVFIPLDWIIGGVKMAGQGWRMLMECLSIGRSISLPALATASAKLCYRNTGAYARVRRQFNTSIASFEGIDEALGFIAGYTYTLEATRMLTAGAVDLKVNPPIASAIAKYHMTELSRLAVLHAMDVHGGHTIQVGPRNFLANPYVGLPISVTVEGANILTRNLIIFGQGAIRCHPYLLKEIELISAATPDVKQLDKVLMSHVGFLAGNMLRAIAYSFTGGKLIFATVKNRRIKKYQRQLTRMSTALAVLADTSLILLGGSLKRRERISARLGDILSELYLASAVLKYFHDLNEPITDVDYVAWALTQNLYKIQQACDALFDNFPYRILGKVLAFLLFPFGRAYKEPKDKLNHAIVQPMFANSEFRDRVTQHIYLSKDKQTLGNRLDTALTKIAAIEPILKKFHKAERSGQLTPHFDFRLRARAAQEAGFMTSEEAQQLIDYHTLVSEIIQVNEFSFDLKTVIA